MKRELPLRDALYVEDHEGLEALVCLLHAKLMEGDRLHVGALLVPLRVELLASEGSLST